MDNSENQLMEILTNSLENSGYLPQIRSDLKINALKISRELLKNKKISENSSLLPKKLNNEYDPVMISIIKDFFNKCGLEKPLEMLNLEIDEKFKDSNLINDLPQINNDENIPIICKIIEKAEERYN